MFSSIGHKMVPRPLSFACLIVTESWSFARKSVPALVVCALDCARFCVVCALSCARILVVSTLDCARLLLHPALFPTSSWNTVNWIEFTVWWTKWCTRRLRLGATWRRWCGGTCTSWCGTSGDRSRCGQRGTRTSQTHRWGGRGGGKGEGEGREGERGRAGQETLRTAWKWNTYFTNLQVRGKGGKWGEGGREGEEEGRGEGEARVG